MGCPNFVMLSSRIPWLLRLAFILFFPFPLFDEWTIACLVCFVFVLSFSFFSFSSAFHILFLIQYLFFHQEVSAMFISAHLSCYGVTYDTSMIGACNPHGSHTHVSLCISNAGPNRSSTCSLYACPWALRPFFFLSVAAGLNVIRGQSEWGCLALGLIDMKVVFFLIFIFPRCSRLNQFHARASARLFLVSL